MSEIALAVGELQAAGVTVLSPAEPTVVDAIGPFLFVASDLHRSIRLVQDRHLDAIRHSAFLWLVCDDGYVGQSASMEIGFAIAYGIPIFSKNLPYDFTLRQYVHQVSSVGDAITISSEVGEGQGLSLLLDPDGAVQMGHHHLESLRSLLLNPSRNTPVFEKAVRDHRRSLRNLIFTPSLSHQGGK